MQEITERKSQSKHYVLILLLFVLFVSLMSSGQFNFQQFKFVGGERVAGRKSGRVMRQYEGVAIIIFQLKYIS